MSSTWHTADLSNPASFHVQTEQRGATIKPQEAATQPFADRTIRPAFAPQSAQVKPVEQPNLDYSTALRNMTNQQASSAIASGAHTVGTYGATPADQAQLNANEAARLDLFKQYHGGLAPGEFMAAQRGQMMAAPGYDPFRQAMADAAAHPQYQMRGGTAVYHGSESPVDFQARAADAAGKLANYDLTNMQTVAANPYTKVGVAQAFASNLPALGAANVLQRGDPSVIRNMPVGGGSEGGTRPGISPQNALWNGTAPSTPASPAAEGHQGEGQGLTPANYVDYMKSRPEYAELADMIEKGAKPHVVSHQLASMPGASVPGSFPSLLWKYHSDAQQANDPFEWQSALSWYNPNSPNHEALHNGPLGDISKALGLDQPQTQINQQFARDRHVLGDHANVPALGKPAFRNGKPSMPSLLYNAYMDLPPAPDQ